MQKKKKTKMKTTKTRERKKEFGIKNRLFSNNDH